MALPACRQCGHEVASDGPRCPYCGLKDPASSLDPRAEFKAQAVVGLFALVVCGLVFLLLLLLGCNDVTGQACTLIGCSDGLNVEVQGVMSDVSVEATSATGETRTAPCQAFSDSTCWVHFDNFVPDEVTIRVADGDNQVSVTTNPSYESLQPNGPDCPPTCRQATVVIRFDPAG